MFSMKPETSIKGRTVLITGGATGIGRATAQKLASKGLNVIITYAHSEEAAFDLVGELKQKYPDIRVEAIKLDFNVPNMESMINDFIRSIEDANHIIHYLVNNAALLKKDSVDDATFDEMMNINFKGPWFLTQTVSKHMIKNQVQGGSIVNVSSVSDTLTFTGFNVSIYDTTKAALTRMTTSLADAYAKSGIRINTIAPGFVDTPMQAEAKRNPSFWKQIESTASLMQIASPEVVANSIYPLLCKSPNQTGSRIVNDGGLTIGSTNLRVPQ